MLCEPKLYVIRWIQRAQLLKLVFLAFMFLIVGYVPVIESIAVDHSETCVAMAGAGPL